MKFMSKGKLDGFFLSLSGFVRRYLFTEQVGRFMLILGVSLFIDYMRELARPCQFLITLDDFSFCPLIMYIYAEHSGLSFWKHVWSLRSLFFIVLAAVVVVLWVAWDSRNCNR